MTTRCWEKKDFLGFYSNAITDRETLPLIKLPGEKTNLRPAMKIVPALR